MRVKGERVLGCGLGGEGEGRVSGCWVSVGRVLTRVRGKGDGKVRGGENF